MLIALLVGIGLGGLYIFAGWIGYRYGWNDGLWEGFQHATKEIEAEKD